MDKRGLEQKIFDYIHGTKALRDLGFTEKASVQFLAQGEYNINFLIDNGEKKYVFRVNTASQLQLSNQIKYEYEALKFLQQSGVTPKVYYLDDTLTFFNYGILIMEYLVGEPLHYDRDLGKAATIFSRIHSLDVGNASHFIVEKSLFTDRITEGERLLANVWESPLVSQEVKQIFYRLLDWAKINCGKEQYFTADPWLVINNTEVNSHNFIIGSNKSYLIDWEKPVISDPAQDITHFLSPTTTLWKTEYAFSSEEKEDFFKIYGSGLAGGDNNIRERVHYYTPYLYLRALAWCASAFVEYHNPAKEIKNMDTFAKIKQYLEVGFMEKLLKDYY